MWKRIVIVVFVVALVGVGVLYASGQLGYSAADVEMPTDTVVVSQAVKAPREIVADAIVVPARQADLVFGATGRVAEVRVAPGDAVQSGETLVSLETVDVEASLAEAILGVEIAEANLQRLECQPQTEDVAAAQAALDVAETHVRNAAAALDMAQIQSKVGLDTVSDQELAIAERRIELAKNALWAAQSGRDSVCGRVGRAAQEADCDAAQAAVQSYEQELAIAELQLEALLAGPTEAHRIAADAEVRHAQGALDAANAQRDQAQAERDRVSQPASAEDLAVARANVEQAEWAVRRAKEALYECELRAPFGATVVRLDLEVGERVTGAESVTIADLSSWRLETVDLSELNVVSLQTGDRAEIGFDALPNVTVMGTIVRIEPFGVTRMGEITYKAVIEPDEMPSSVRWNMTAEVRVTPGE